MPISRWEERWKREGEQEQDWRSAFFPEDALPWQAGDEATSEASEALSKRKWPVVREQFLWLAVLEQAVADSLHAKPEYHEPARAFILSRGFRVILQTVALRSEFYWDARAIRARLKLAWGVG